ncbi:hypothetical protein [Halorarum halobium]|uniref:hypothetical protein n=1 Tax=Halorarum halobium TaxID=3075121 RepID=UPI0028B0ADFD|nr:hypothetical protein [Halobaculum sp. XH14]
MERRGVLVGIAGLVAGTGCTESTQPSGPRTPPRSPVPTEPPATGLVIAGIADEAAEDGTLLLRVTVENRSGESQSGTVVADVQAGDEESTVSQSVTVEPDGQLEVELETGLEYEAFSGNGSLSVDVQ